MRKVFFIAVLCGLLNCVSICAQSQGKVVNGTAAIINKKVITIKDAYVYRALQRMNTGTQPVLMEEQGEELRKTVQKIVFEEMVLAEMKSLQKEVEVSIVFDSWKKSKKSADLALIRETYGLGENELYKSAVKTIKADKFVKLKIDTVTPVVTEDEAQKYFKKNEAQFRGKSYESIRPNIIVLLKKQSVQKSLEEWIKSLKDKYEASILLDSL